MSDIITRLLLKTDDFDAKLTRSKAGVNSYQNDVSSMAKTAGAGIAKFAGALGLAIGAGEGLMKVIQGSQATNDAFDNNMNACKDSVDAFFIALSTGDFSVFENGLLSVFSKAKELSAALDDIADKRLSIDLVDLRKQGEMTALEAIIRDTSKTKQERSDALSKYQSLAKEVAANRLDIAKEELTGNTNVELNKIGVKNLSQDDVTLYLEKLNNKDLNQQFLKELKYVSDYSKKYNEAWASVEKYRSRNGADAKSFQMEADFNNKWESPDKWMKRAFPNSEFKDSKQLMDFGKLFQQNDNGRTALYEYTKRLYEAENQNAADIRKLTKLKNSANAAGGGGKKDETPLAGSLAYFDAEIAKKNKELVNATTAQARTAVQVAIDELEAKRINLKIELDKSVFKELHGEMKGGDLKMGGIPMQGIGISKKDIKNMKLPKFKSPISEKDVDINRQYAESLGGIGSAFGTMGQMAAQFGDEGMAFALNSVGTIAQMIVQLQGLAMANGVANAMSLPFPANLAAIATVVGAVTSIFANLPGFATGGIVGGSSFAGDNVLARVNSGEMILNASQQSNLFRLLNGQVSAQRPVLGNISNIRMQPGKQIVEVGGQVRIQGGDLILAINNKNSKMKGKR